MRNPLLVLLLAFLSVLPCYGIGPDKDDPVAGQAAFKLGKAAYDARKYPEAQKQLSKAAALYSKSAAIQYYLGIAAAQNGDVQTVKRAMARIIACNRLSSPNGKQAIAMLSKYANACQPSCSLNGANQIVRFKKGDMPIKVFYTDGLMLPPPFRGQEGMRPSDVGQILAMVKQGDAFLRRLQRDPNYQSGHRGNVMQGMQKWSWAQSEGLFTYQVVNTIKDADVVVFWCPKMNAGDGGYTSSGNLGSAGKLVVIQVATTYPHPDESDPNHADKYMVWVGTHEFGHVWGLAHSQSTDDIMYKSPGSYDAVPGNVSENDKMTLRALYDIAPDFAM